MGSESGPPGCQGSGRGPGLEIQQPVVWARASIQPCPPCLRPCQKARATLRRMEAELYSSRLEKRTSRWLCTRPPPSPLPGAKKTGRLPLLTPLLCPSGGRGAQHRAGSAAVTGWPGLARAGAGAAWVAEGGRRGTSHPGSCWLARTQNSGHQDAVGAAWDVLVTPFDHQRVLPLVLEQVGDAVEPAAHVLHQDLLAGCPGPVYPDQQHVVAWGWGKGPQCQAPSPSPQL